MIISTSYGTLEAPSQRLWSLLQVYFQIRKWMTEIPNSEVLLVFVFLENWFKVCSKYTSY